MRFFGLDIENRENEHAKSGNLAAAEGREGEGCRNPKLQTAGVGSIGVRVITYSKGLYGLVAPFNAA